MKIRLDKVTRLHHAKAHLFQVSSWAGQTLWGSFRVHLCLHWWLGPHYRCPSFAACLLVSSWLLSGIPLKTIGEATQTLINGKMVNRVAVEVPCIGGKKCWLLMCGRDAKDLCCFHPPSVQVFGAGKTMMTTTSRHWMPASLLNVYSQHVS